MSTLNDVEIRVLGSLVEKQITTPEYYPLTLNSLTLACNQKNNRKPVTSYSEPTVSEALESLREKNLVYVFYGSTSRVPKYKHVMPEVMHLSAAELAIMDVLMLRGAQTPGELRGNGSRLHQFSGLEEVEETLVLLMSRDPDPLVIRLPRQLGQKEVRFAHLLSGPIDGDVEAVNDVEPPRRAARSTSPDRVQELEAQVAALRADVSQLQEQFDTFRKQFE
jgi:uncharacterized protein YceH (UPF0502 family)